MISKFTDTYCCSKSEEQKDQKIEDWISRVDTRSIAGILRHFVNNT